MNNIYINKETGEEVELLRIGEDWERIYTLKPIKKNQYVEGAIMMNIYSCEVSTIDPNTEFEDLVSLGIPILARTIIQMAGDSLDWVEWVTYSSDGLHGWDREPAYAKHADTWIATENYNVTKMMEPILNPSIPYSECIWEIKRL